MFLKQFSHTNYLKPLFQCNKLLFRIIQNSTSSKNLLRHNHSKTVTINIKNSTHLIMDKLNTCYIFVHPDQEQFDTIILCSSEKLGIINRRFNFKRQLNELLETFLKRVETNIDKLVNKKQKRKKQEQNDSVTECGVSSIPVNLQVGDSNVDTTVSCKQFFDDVLANDYRNIHLVLGEEKLTLKLNTPWIERIELPETMMAGFPVYPKKFESTFVDKNVSKYNWFKRTNSKCDWVQVCEDFIYFPKNEDVGQEVKFSCVPCNQRGTGPISAVIAEDKIQAGPGVCPFQLRHAFTSHKLQNRSFRVVTYNILADLYTDSDYSRNQLFPYCPPYALTIDYRKLLILKEILGYNADIICMQEVDSKVFNFDISIAMPEFEGVFHKKGGGSVNEGLCTLYNSNRFKRIHDGLSGAVQIGDLLKTDEMFVGLKDKLLSAENGRNFFERITNLKSIMQITVLESLDVEKILLVANVHFYFAPDSDHIRLFQGGLCIKYLESLREKIKQMESNKEVNLVICGDFNSTPDCGIYQLFTTGSVSEQSIDWTSNHEQRVEGIRFDQSLILKSACGTPEFTNFTAHFSACLDYIYCEKTAFEVEQVVPLPTNDQLTENTALPSVVFPSDHVSLVADLKWV